MDAWIRTRSTRGEGLSLLEQAWALEQHPVLAVALIIAYHGLRRPEHVAKVRARIDPVVSALPYKERHYYLSIVSYAEKDYVAAVDHVQAILAKDPNDLIHLVVNGLLLQLYGTLGAGCSGYSKGRRLGK